MEDRNDKNLLNYEAKNYNPIDDFAEWYRTNGKTNVKKETDHTETYKKKIDGGDFNDVPAIMKMSYGFEKLEEAKEAERRKQNEKSDQ